LTICTSSAARLIAKDQVTTMSESGEMGSMVKRAGFNTLLFGVLLAGIGAFTRVRTGAPEIVDVVAVAVLGGLWAGALVALIEVKLAGLERGPRLLLSAVCGALAYVGLFVAMSRLAGLELRAGLVGIGAALGAVSHAVRAAASRSEPADDDDDDDHRR
jgi:hypothetical protein